VELGRRRRHHLDADRVLARSRCGALGALRYCRACAVRLDCLEYAWSALPVNQPGVWGGVSARDRRRASVRGMSAAELLATVDETLPQ
jgi:hypothetical protein